GGFSQASCVREASWSARAPAPLCSSNRRRGPTEEFCVTLSHTPMAFGLDLVAEPAHEWGHARLSQVRRRHVRQFGESRGRPENDAAGSANSLKHSTQPIRKIWNSSFNCSLNSAPERWCWSS